MTLASVPLQSAAPQLVSRSTPTIVGYVAALFVAELLLAQGGFLAGGISHMLLLVMLLVHHATTEDAAYRPILLALTLPSLMRVVSLTVTVVDLPPVLWLMMIGVPIFVAALLVLRAVPVGLGSLVANPSDLPLQVVVALSGIAHGVMLFLILRPAALVQLTEPGAALAAVLVLVLFVAVLEEVVFRGIIQSVALEITGSRTAAIVIGGTVYACMFVSADSPIAPLAMLAIGIVFGATVAFTKSLWGVIGAHGLMSIGLLITWPAVLG
jgi:membrane protease YdiL (CAAX protease family)